MWHPQGFHPLLTPRELQVLDMATQGLTTMEIASQLGISEGRVEQIRRKARERLKVFSIVQAVEKARRLNLLSPEREHVRVIQEHWQAINAHDVSEFVASMHADCAWKSDAMPQMARRQEPVRDAVRLYFEAFPDLTMVEAHIVCYGDEGVVFWTADGTHMGEFLGIQPTYRHGRVDGCTRLILRDGRIDFMRDYWDMNTLMEQLGLVQIDKVAHI